MGDRGQVEVKMYDDDPSVFLYTHWKAHDLHQDVARALNSRAGRGRGNDHEYLARIIFDVMKGDDVTGETGYGIGTTKHSDLALPPIVVDPNTQTVDGMPYAKFITKYLKG